MVFRFSLMSPHAGYTCAGPFPNHTFLMAAGVVIDLTLYNVNPTGKEIGRGAYGRVFEVDYQGTLCAAKEVHSLLLEWSQGEALRKIRADFLSECQIWSTIRHPCIVQFLGMLLNHVTP